ncbi:MAG: cupin domain-containing protein [Acidobacteria bacterium]|nr:cupin domain-containing protein [Acidobacteriota bacterium]
MPENRTSENMISLRAGEGTSWWLMTDLHTFKAVSEDTNGAFTLTELTAAADFGPPPHIHHREDEAFYVLDGQFEFRYNDRTFTAGPGSFVYLKKGRVHMHRATGGAPARALVLHTPAGLERFIREAGKPATDRTATPGAPPMPELERIVAVAQKYDIEVPPPPS